MWGSKEGGWFFCGFMEMRLKEDSLFSVVMTCLPLFLRTWEDGLIGLCLMFVGYFDSL